MACSLLALSTGNISCFPSPQLVPHQDFCGRTWLVLGCAYSSVEKHFLPLEAYSPEYCMFNQICHFHYITSGKKTFLGGSEQWYSLLCKLLFLQQEAIFYFQAQSSSPTSEITLCWWSDICCLGSPCGLRQQETSWSRGSPAVFLCYKLLHLTFAVAVCKHRCSAAQLHWCCIPGAVPSQHFN